mmetsp:Transcript_18350/g.27693  ORF Transcript_18350/g.27693 Transcript_18350/m.27693 type:complete len:128 (+) Transcript_18350:108-491(+)
MSNAQAILLCVAVAFAVAHGFTSSLNQINVQSQCKKPSARSNMVMKWPGDRPPKTNPKRKELLMDASWARADERVDVFEDKPNPTYPWWETYFPTEEEIEAAAQGYDFENPVEWLEQQRKKKDGQQN